MKKLFCIMLALLCLCSAVPVALAADMTYKLPELNMTIEVPEGWYAFKRGVKEGDPNFEVLGMSSKEFADLCKDSGIYLLLLNTDLKAMIFVGMEDISDDSKYVDYNYRTDEDLQQTMSELEKEGSILDSTIYLHRQSKFVIYSVGKSIFYRTLINGQCISISLILNEGEVSDSLAQTLKRTVSSIVFTKVSSEPIAPPGSDTATFELPELNMTLASPNGWTVFTQDIDENDLFLALLGIDAKEFEEQFKENDIYLDMISEYPYDHIIVTMKESDDPDIYDYNDITDEDLLELASGMQGAQEQALSDFSVYKHKQAKFIVSDFTNYINGQPGFGKLYITVINGQKIIIMLQSMSEVQGSLEQTLQDTVDNIIFTKVISRPAIPEPATYELPELKMNIDSPEKWYVFTRDVKEDDPALEFLGIDGKGLADYYKENGTYIDMISSNPKIEIFVTMAEYGASRDIYDINNMTDEDILPEVESIMYEAEEEMEGQTTFSDCSVYTHKQAKFVVYDFTQLMNDRTLYGKKYFTVINGQVINITLISNGEEISDSLEQTLRSTVDSITFMEVTPKPVDDFVAVYASLAGAMVGALIGAAVFAARKRRMEW